MSFILFTAKTSFSGHKVMKMVTAKTGLVVMSCL